MLLLQFAANLSEATSQEKTGNIARLKSERIFYHPGFLGKIQRKQLDLFTTRLFGMKELSQHSGFLFIPSRDTGYCMSLSSFGGDKYSETKIGAAYLKKITKSFVLSSEFETYSINITGQKRKSEYSVHAGIACFFGTAGIGARVLNTISGGNGNLNQTEDMGFLLTGKVKLSPFFRFGAALLKQKNYRDMAAFECRANYKDTIVFSFLSGINPDVYSGGFELYYSRFSFMFFIKHHNELGNTSQVGAGVFF